MKLELNKETLVSLSDESLQEVAGGAATTGCTGGYATQTFVCPSGATWFTDCESTWVSCG
ncbi:MAG TPA: class I lanthipeptide [Actinomycetota bacterium]|nr:class I lanthipeptide [Actinomycetota bacterium]